MSMEELRERIDATYAIRTLASGAQLMPVHELLIEALDHTRVFLPAELQRPVEDILHVARMQEVSNG